MQKTAYEVRISDWISDVCSSDLLLVVGDELDGVLDLVLQVGRARPVGQSHPAAHMVEPGIQAEREAIGGIAQQGEPLGAGEERKSVVEGKSGSVRVDRGGRGILKNKIREHCHNNSLQFVI